MTKKLSRSNKVYPPTRVILRQTDEIKKPILLRESGKYKKLQDKVLTLEEKIRELSKIIDELTKEIAQLRAGGATLTSNDINALINARLPKASDEVKLAIFKKILEDNIELRNSIRGL